MKIFMKGPINNNSAVVQNMAWYGEGDKPLPEPKGVLCIKTTIVMEPSPWVMIIWTIL